MPKRKSSFEVVESAAQRSERLQSLFMDSFPTRVWEQTNHLPDGTPVFGSREVTKEDRARRAEFARSF